MDVETAMTGAWVGFLLFCGLIALSLLRAAHRLTR